jgi:hypothetical protein
MPAVGPDGVPTTDGQLEQVRDLRPAIVAPTNAIADQIVAALPADLLAVERDLLFQGMLTAAHRLTQTGGGPLCRGRQRV